MNKKAITDTITEMKTELHFIFILTQKERSHS